MNQSPRFSVLIPAYNHAAFLEDSVESALSQADSIEVLVLDDGSTDGTAEVLNRLGRREKVRVSRQDNAGAHRALNRLLEMARGDYCAILNSDDLFLPGRLDGLAGLLERRSDAIMAASWIRIIDAQGRELGIKEGWKNMPPWPRPSSGPCLEDLDDPALALLQSNWVSTTSNMLFRRRDIVEKGLSFRPLRYCHDWDFLLSALASGDMALLPEAKLSYRVHGANTIAEGGEESDGRALMLWEILWTVARHAAVISEKHARDRDIKTRLLRSLPDFGRRDLLAALLALRGSAIEAPRAYDDLLIPGHPFREAALRSLSSC